MAEENPHPARKPAPCGKSALLKGLKSPQLAIESCIATTAVMLSWLESSTPSFECKPHSPTNPATFEVRYQLMRPSLREMVAVL